MVFYPLPPRPPPLLEPPLDLPPPELLEAPELLLGAEERVELLLGLVLFEFTEGLLLLEVLDRCVVLMRLE
jgi:hypothetical protein